jgi:hypothetical protein
VSSTVCIHAPTTTYLVSLLVCEAAAVTADTIERFEDVMGEYASWIFGGMVGHESGDERVRGRQSNKSTELHRSHMSVVLHQSTSTTTYRPVEESRTDRRLVNAED